MARVKPKRHGVSIDMTAMCDVAFLLLTFFILTTKFKEPDAVPVKPPSSISETILPDSNVMTVSVNPDGKFYFLPADNGKDKMEVLKKMGVKHGMTFSNEELAAFAKTPSFGVSMSKMKGFLKLDDVERKKYVDDKGIPMDSVQREVIDWVENSLLVNPKTELAVKGDGAAKYNKVKYLFEGLKDIKKNNFLLITSQEKQ